MSIRDKPTYLSHEVWRALWILSRCNTDPNHQITIDEIADQKLRESITKDHPQLFEHQARIDKLEKELIASLSKKAGEGSTESRQQK